MTPARMEPCQKPRFPPRWGALLDTGDEARSEGGHEARKEAEEDARHRHDVAHEEGTPSRQSPAGLARRGSTCRASLDPGAAGGPAPGRLIGPHLALRPT